MTFVRETFHEMQNVDELRVSEAPQGVASSSLIVAATHPADIPPSKNGACSAAPVESGRPAATPAPKRGFAVSSILASAVIALVFGSVGAWVFLTYLAPAVTAESPNAAREHAGSTPPPVVPIGPSAEDFKQLTKEIDDLSMRLDRLQERVSAAAHPEPPQDLSSLQQTIASLEKDNESYASLPGRLSALSDRIATLEEAVAAFQNDRNSAGAQARNAPGTTRLPRAALSGREAEVAERPQPASNNENDAGPDLAQAAELLRSGKFTEARDLCAMLEESHADDARVWYYGALANGLATGRWDRETERLANKGVERERVGSPSKAKIDSALTSLMPISGRDWIASIRRNARR